MAISIDYSVNPHVITVPQADLTLVTGTLYEMDTETDFRQAVIALQASADGMVFDDAIRHNTEVTVAGTTFSRTIEVLNSSNSSNFDEYTVQFTPDSQWSVRFTGSNNNIFDVENGQLTQNQVQVIPNNSAGGQTVSSGSGLDAGQDTKLTRIHALLDVIEGTLDHQEVMRLLLAAAAGKLDGANTTNVTIRDQADSKDRIDATVDEFGNRTAVSVDAS